MSQNNLSDQHFIRNLSQKQNEKNFKYTVMCLKLFKKYSKVLILQVMKLT